MIFEYYEVSTLYKIHVGYSLSTRYETFAIEPTNLHLHPALLHQVNSYILTQVGYPDSLDTTD